jgi:sRNA-binding regulator protein Hfq
MRDSRPARPVLPATGGQLDQIRSLSRRLGLEEPALIEQIGRPIESLDHLGARSAIAKLRQLMEDSGTWQPRVGEGPDQEGEYLGKLRDRRLPIEVQLINGERLRGVIDDFTPYVVRLRNPDGGTEVSVRKLAIAYYQTPGPIDDAE